MIMISHRGNLTGPRPNLENRPEYIQTALSKGYYVEVDVWMRNEKILLGHDQPVYTCDLDFLKDSKIICHAKNYEIINFFTQQSGIHWFWHEKDFCTLTSRGWIWTYPHNVVENSILNQPEFNQNWNPEEAIAQYKWYISRYGFMGVCSDYIEIFKDIGRSYV